MPTKSVMRCRLTAVAAGCRADVRFQITTEIAIRLVTTAADDSTS